MKKTILAWGLSVACFAAVVTSASPAHAKLFDVYGSLKTGAVGGQGFTNLTAAGSDYFDIEHGPTMGFELGVELLFIDVSLQAFQFFDFGAKADNVQDKSATAGTLFEFLVGLDVDIPIDSERVPKWFLRLGGNGGIAAGLHRKVAPPLDNGEVSDKGFIAQAILGLDYHINQVFYLGVEFLPGYHYFVPGGDKPANQASQGMQYMGFLTFQVHLEPANWGKKK